MFYDPSTGVCYLSIRHLTVEDDGEYTCTAANVAGEASLSITIQRNQPGQSLIPPQQEMYTANRWESTSSQSQSHQTSSFQSSQQFSGIASQSHYSTQFAGTSDFNQSTFQVESFEYRLISEADFRQTLLCHETIVQGGEIFLPNEPPAAPQVQQKANNCKLIEGSPVVLQAKVYGNPLPRIYWFKNGQMLTQNQNLFTTYDDFVATLHINVAGQQDTGYYTMLADSSQGCIVSSAHLVIEPKTLTSEQLIGTQQIQQQQHEVRHIGTQQHLHHHQQQRDSEYILYQQDYQRQQQQAYQQAMQQQAYFDHHNLDSLSTSLYEKALSL